MKFFSLKKNNCNDCNEKFNSQDELARHVKEVHKHNVRKCQKCGKIFLNEKERLHHIKEEKQKEIESQETLNICNILFYYLFTQKNLV